MNKPISPVLEKAIMDRKTIVASGSSLDYCEIADEDEPYQFEAVSPVICEGDAVGAVVLLSKEKRVVFGDTEKKLAASAAGFLGKQMEQ